MQYKHLELQMLRLAQANQHVGIRTFLNEHRTLQLTNLRDDKQQTVLHLACFNGNLALLQYYLHFLKRQLSSSLVTQSQLVDLVNAQNDEGFTALHLASYKGSLQMIHELQGEGADNQIRNHDDLSVMHTAAQGDSPLLICYYKSTLSVNIKDRRGSTPLHWAAFSGSYYATCFLIAWGADISCRDSDTGVTPLHLAVIQGHSRIVKKLVQKGANKLIKNFSGKTAVDFAREAENTELLNILCCKGGLLGAFLSVRNDALVGVYLSIFISTMVMTILFTFPCIVGNTYIDVKSTIWMVIFLFVSCQTITLFCFSWLMNPGYITKEPAQPLLELLDVNDCRDICPDCEVYRPKRSRHCDICKRCVYVYDHHCPWISNCVGVKNQWLFYGFIVSMLIEILIQLVMQSEHVHSKIMYLPASDERYLGKQITAVYVLIVCCIFIIPVSLLVWVQTVNIITGLTTYERLSKKNQTQRKNVLAGLCSNKKEMQEHQTEFIDRNV